jgi:hypothetical protein
MSRHSLLTSLAVSGVLLVGSGLNHRTDAAKPTGCADVPLSMTFVATTAAPAAIWNDLANSAYQNGVDGVSSVIHYNKDCNGTRDATLGLYRSRRTLWMQYPSPVSGSIITSGPPSFAGSAPFTTQAHIVVHNILGRTVLTPGAAATFYTKVGSMFIGPDGNNYRLRFLPDDFACPEGATCVPNLEGNNGPADTNQPVETAWAAVTYTPRNPAQPWSLANADRWVVDGEQTSPSDPVYQRATLHLEGAHFTFTHQGQYSMPFKILITALAALP